MGRRDFRLRSERPLRLASSIEIRLAREARVAVLWDRFLGLLVAEGESTAEYTAHSVLLRRSAMRKALRQGRPRGWFFLSELEAADLGMESPVQLGDADPTPAAPGTREKVEVMAGRVAAGCPLWHPEDFQAGHERH